MANKNITGYYQNVRGLRTKSHAFLSSVIQSDYDFICITETWLTSDFFDREYFDHRYSVFRSDRSASRSGASRGGGVAVSVLQELRPVRRDWPVPPDACCDCVWVSVPLDRAKQMLAATSRTTRSADAAECFLNIACIYIPQGTGYRNSLSTFFELAGQIVIERPNDLFLITGDFNIASANWTPTPTLEAQLATSGNFAIQYLQDFISFTELKQYNLMFNSYNRILDLVFSNKDCYVTSCDNPLTDEDLHHKALSLNLNICISPLIEPPANISTFNFYKCNFDEINKAITDINWSGFFKKLNTEQSISKFYDFLKSLFESFVPRRNLPSSTSSPVWFTKCLKKILKEKRKYHKRWKLYGNPLDYESFKILRKRAAKLERECYNNYIQFSAEKIKSNPKFFWSFVKSINSNKGVPQTMFYKGASTSDGEQICDWFNEHFHSVFENHNVTSHQYNFSNSSNAVIDLSSIDLTETIIYKYLKSIDPNKGAGPDGVHPFFIKKCSSSLAVPITIIFNKSMKEGIVPDIWKQAFVTPIPKGAVSNDIEKYRPISKLSQFPKIFEKIVADQLTHAIRRHICISQHGFYKGRSVDTNLLTFTDEILKSMDEGYQVDAVYTDFAKAFDKICHNTLLDRLWALGIHGDLFRWIKSYVQNRSQAVVVAGYSSHFKTISSGVPQGSHLGPLLFTLYINEVTNTLLYSNSLLYADDAKIYKIIKEPNDCVLLQQDLARFESFCNDSSLILNLDKCSVITFSRKVHPVNYNYALNNSEIRRVNEIRDLGVLMDSKLSFVPHIDNILDKSFRQLGFILRVSKPFRDPLIYKILFNSFVRSRLEFACSVWKPFSKCHKERIERVQKKFLKSVEWRTGNIYNDYIQSAKRHRVQLLDIRRDCVDAITFYKILNNHLDAPSLLGQINLRVPRRRERQCRHNNLFFIPRSRTCYASNTFIKRACKLFNENEKLSDIDIFHCSISEIKSKFKI